MSELVRQFFDRLKSLWGSASEADLQTTFTRAAPWIVATFLFIFIVYYPLGMLVFNEIDDNLDVAPSPQYSVADGS